MNNIPNERPRLFPPRSTHLDDLQVRPCYAFTITPSQMIVLGGGYRQRQLELMFDDARQWSDDGREL